MISCRRCRRCCAVQGRAAERRIVRRFLRASGERGGRRLGRTGCPASERMTPKVSTAKPASPRQGRTWEPLLESLRRDRAKIAEGGGAKAIERQHEKNRLTARERIARLIDPDSSFFEFGRFSALGHVRRMGAGSGGQRDLRRRRRGRAAVHDRRQRRHGEGRRVLSDDRQKSAAGAADRHGESAAADLSGRFGRRHAAPAGGGLSRRGRFRPHFSQQRGALGASACRRSPPSWATASPAAVICPCCATSW